MSEYGTYTIRKPPLLLSHDSVQEAKAARKKLLKQVEQRRAENYKQFMEKKRRLQADSNVV